MSTVVEVESPIGVVEAPKKKSKSLWSDAWARLKKNKASVVSFYFISFICLVAIFADYIAPYSFEEQYLDRVLQPPSSQHWLGTDSLGRDLFSRIIYGARMSMAVGIFTSVISLFIGAFLAPSRAGSVEKWTRLSCDLSISFMRFQRLC